MKRDMDLVREILFAIEARGLGERGAVRIDGRSEAEIGFHVWLMSQEELVRAVDITTMSSPCRMADPIDITWRGYDFLDQARSDTVWNAAKNKVASTMQTVSFSVLLELLKETAKQQLGLK